MIVDDDGDDDDDDDDADDDGDDDDADDDDDNMYGFLFWQCILAAALQKEFLAVSFRQTPVQRNIYFVMVSGFRSN